MATLTLVSTGKPYGSFHELVSIETDGASWPQPLISGVYLRKDSWGQPDLPDIFTIYMAEDRETGELTHRTNPGVRIGGTTVGYSLRLELVADSEYSRHIKYVSLQESRPRKPIINGVYLLKSWFAEGLPPHLLTVRFGLSASIPRSIPIHRT